ncbi:MAG: hypothetical protein SOX32_00190 [Candidatus Choladocola sp.]|nr:hypothetical protein [Candidatus Choladocola sp.]
MEQRILDIIKESEMILVGIGEELASVCPPFAVDQSLEPYYRSRYFRNIPEENERIQSYNRLKRLIGAKPYFVVTLNTDDLIYRSELENDLIVSPCGSMLKMQCGDHIVDAAPICDAVLAAAENQEDRDCANRIEDMDPQRFAVCPECGKTLSFHVKETEDYMEEGYLAQWEKYNRWLSCTLNHRLCILELGAGFSYPQVIRWPFEKVAYFNRKATLIRVHSRLPQITEELSERGIAIKADPGSWLLD